jgi:hypothetical protein
MVGRENDGSGVCPRVVVVGPLRRGLQVSQIEHAVHDLSGIRGSEGEDDPLLAHRRGGCIGGVGKGLHVFSASTVADVDLIILHRSVEDAKRPSVKSMGRSPPFPATHSDATDRTFQIFLG